jgi:hypothetical protein
MLLGSAYGKVTLDVNGVHTGVNQANASLEKLKAGFESLSAKVQVAMLAVSGAVVAFGTASFMAAARVDELRVVNGVLAKNAGLSANYVEGVAQAIHKQGIESAVSEEAVAQFLRANLDLSKAADLARVAQDAAVISGMNSTDTYNAITEGIVKMNPEILRTAGITIDGQAAIKAYALTLGVAVDSLTTAQKQGVYLNEVLKAGVPIAGAYAAAMTEPSKVLRSFPRYFNDIFVAVGETIKPVFGEAVFTMAEFLKNLEKAVSKGGALRPVLESLAQALTPIVTAFSNWIKNIDFEVIARWLEGFVSLLEINIPIAMNFIQLLGGAIGDIVKLLSYLPEPVRGSILSIGLFGIVGLSVIGPIMKFVDALKLIEGMFVVIKGYGVAGGLIGPAVAPALTGAETAVSGFGATALSAILPVIPALALLYWAYKTNFGGIKDTVDLLAANLPDIIQKLSAMLSPLGLLAQALNALGFTDIAAKLWGFVKSMNGLNEDTQKTAAGVTESMTGMDGVMKDVSKSMSASMKEMTASIDGAMGDTKDAIAKASKDIGKETKGLEKDFGTSGQKSGANYVSGLSQTLSQSNPEMQNIGTQLGTSLRNGFSKAANVSEWIAEQKNLAKSSGTAKEKWEAQQKILQEQYQKDQEALAKYYQATQGSLPGSQVNAMKQATTAARGLGPAMETASKRINTELFSIEKNTQETFNPELWRKSGGNISEGIAGGMDSKRYLVIQAAHTSAQAALDAFRQSLLIRSPSQKFAWLGEMSALGYMSGLSRSIDPAQIANTIARPVQSINRNAQQNNTYNLANGMTARDGQRMQADSERRMQNRMLKIMGVS